MRHLSADLSSSVVSWWVGFSTVLEPIIQKNIMIILLHSCGTNLALHLSSLVFVSTQYIVLYDVAHQNSLLTKTLCLRRGELLASSLGSRIVAINEPQPFESVEALMT
jgi:hypothetical protein